MAGNTNKIDSNVTGLRYQEELFGCIGVANTDNDWIVLEPNSYDSFGGEITTIARNPINSGRQRQKGVVTDLDASGGFNSDLTQENLQDILQGYFFADLRRKNDVGVDRQPRRDGFNGEFDDYLITDIDGSDVITVDSRVGVSAAVVVGGTLYAVDDIIEGVDAGSTITSFWRVATEAGGVVLTLDLVDPAVVVGGFKPREGRTDTDTGAGITTVAQTGIGDDALTITITYGNGLAWKQGDLLFTTGLDDAPNNGLLEVLSVTDNLITTVETLTLDATPAAAATMTTVGFEGLVGDIDVDDSGAYATYTSTSLDFTTLQLIPGEWIFVGGDDTSSGGDAFTNVDGDGLFVNNGYKRIRSIAANALVVDKSALSMTTEADTTQFIRMFFGRVIKNESDVTVQRRRSYQLERQLGAPDATLPAEIQAEYLEGSVASEITFTFNTADKVTVDLSFMSLDNTQIDGPTSLKAGARRTLVVGDAFNTSSDFSRLKLHILSDTDENPDALFAFLTEFTLVINNNLTPNKAISVLGSFDITAGNFTVDGSMVAYFSDVTGVQAVRNNADVSLDFSVVKGSTGAKAGITVDVPLIALGDGRLNVEQDAPITLALDTPAAADRLFDHTLLMVFFDFLPDAADTA